MEMKITIEIVGSDALTILKFLTSQATGGLIDVTSKDTKTALPLEKKKGPGRLSNAEKALRAKAKAEEEETEEETEETEEDEAEEESEDDAEEEEAEESEDEDEDEGRAKKGKKAPKKEKGKKKLTMEGDIVPAFTRYTNKHSRDKAGELLKKLGIKNSVRKAPPELWPKLLKALNEEK